MLKIYAGDMEGVVYNPSSYFDNWGSIEWLNHDLAKAIVKDVDRSTVIGPRLIDSPFLGPIGPKDLSGGTKALLCMAFDATGRIFNAVGGDNCAKWIWKISKIKDLTINIRHIIDFSEIEDFEALILNIGKVVTSFEEYIDTISDFV